MPLALGDNTFTFQNGDVTGQKVITRVEPKKPKKNVYKLVTMLVETQKTAPGAVCTTYQNRTVATFGKGALLDLMKPLMLTVRARHRFDRWVSQPTEKHRDQAEKTYLKAKRLVLAADTSAEGERAQSPFFYGRSLVNLCVEILSAIHEGLYGKTWVAVAVNPPFVASRPLPDQPIASTAVEPWKAVAVKALKGSILRNSREWISAPRARPAQAAR